METFLISFAGSIVSIQIDTNKALNFLDFLFTDIPPDEQAIERKTFSLTYDDETATYSFLDDHTQLYRGKLGVKCAALIYDSVIYYLLSKASDGIALHGGAVTYNNRVVLLPGISGAGKSSLTGWLISRGYSYLTDELVFFPKHHANQVQYLSRPVCLKPKSVPLLKPLVADGLISEVLEDKDGAIIPHRLLNSAFKKVSSLPELILLPDYQSGSPLDINKMSKAQLSTILMGCHVNARNLENHGFNQILTIAKSTPAYRISYSNFQGVSEMLDTLLEPIQTD